MFGLSFMMIKREIATLLSMLQVLLLLYYPGFKVIDLKIFPISDYRCLDMLESCELTVLHASALLSLAIAWSKKKKKYRMGSKEHPWHQGEGIYTQR